MCVPVGFAGVPPADGARGRRRVQRSYVVYGTAADAARVRARLTAAVAVPPPDVITVAELLTRWVLADHGWKPSTLVGSRSTVAAPCADRFARRRAAALTPAILRADLARWAEQGRSQAVLGIRFRALRSALGWAWTERLIDTDPVRAMRGPARVESRRPLPEEQVRALITTAELALLESVANHDGDAYATTGRARGLHHAQQRLLLVRLAADTGARRGEIAALHLADLEGRRVTISRAISAGVLSTPKSGTARTLTLGATTADLWHHLAQDWQQRTGHQLGPWLFSAEPDHQTRVRTETLGAWFNQI